MAFSMINKLPALNRVNNSALEDSRGNVRKDISISPIKTPINLAPEPQPKVNLSYCIK